MNYHILKKKNQVMISGDYLRSFMKVFSGSEEKENPKKFFWEVRNFFSALLISDLLSKLFFVGSLTLFRFISAHFREDMLLPRCNTTTSSQYICSKSLSLLEPEV